MPHLSRRRVAALAVAVALLALLAPGVALAAPSAPSAPSTQPAYVRLAHLSPDTPSVDVYVAAVGDSTRSFIVPGVSYGTVSDYRPLAAGTYVVSMRMAGAPASTLPVISTTVDARPGSAYTIAGVGPAATLGLTVLPDRLAIPAPGRASVRVINAALSVPTADIGPVSGPTWATDVRFGSTTGYAEVPIGSWLCNIVSDGRSLAQLPVDIRGNSVYTVLLLDRGHGLVTELHTDSTGAAVVPVGGVETGFGGTAPGAPPAVSTAAVALVLTLCGLSAAAIGRSRRAVG